LFAFIKIMGNLEVKEKFQNIDKDGCAKLAITPAVLFEEGMITVILEYMVQSLNINEPDWGELFKQTNVQKNEYEDRHFEETLSKHLQENYVAGFQTAESQLETLKESSKCHYPNPYRTF